MLSVSLKEVDYWTVKEITESLYWLDRRDQAAFRNGWEQTRLLAAYIISPYSKSKISDLKAFMPFEWDNNGGGAKVGSKEWLEQRRRVISKLKEIDGGE